ncbi:unnamed protein product [Pedinophyceae sp. YPF-701]|nr:unnamed protein product [Pedinophyceae sp. YPF-701]
MKVLVVFLHRLLDFRTLEFRSLAEYVGVKDARLEEPFGGSLMSPFWYVHLPDERAQELSRTICDRAALVKSMIQVWAEGATLDELVEDVRRQPPETFERYISQQESFKVIVDYFGRRVSTRDQQDVFDKLAFLRLGGKVSLTNPEQLYIVIRADPDGLPNRSGLPEGVPTRWYFGRVLADHRKRKESTSKFALPDRPYIGPTSMDPTVAQVMCNVGGVGPGRICFDPFVGTGSILVTAAYLGGYTFGSDIDIRVVRDGMYKTDKDGRKLTLWRNFQHYGLPSPVGFLATDVHRTSFRMQVLEGLVDSIVCDPPYGVRAGGRKSVPRDLPATMTAEQRKAHVPHTGTFTMVECLADLLDLASRALRVGGRVVFFLPWPHLHADAKEHEEIRILASHPVLRLTGMGIQHLTTRYTRLLVVFEKRRACGADDAELAAASRAMRAADLVFDRMAEIIYTPASELPPEDAERLKKRKFRGKMH